jgi:hypothetical protein
LVVPPAIQSVRMEEIGDLFSAPHEVTLKIGKTQRCGVRLLYKPNNFLLIWRDFHSVSLSVGSDVYRNHSVVEAYVCEAFVALDTRVAK